MMKITEVALETGGTSEDDDGVDEDDEDNRGAFKDWWS